MQEYVTPAIILRRETTGEYDERISFFSRRFGKMTARMISSRKILSKLSPHLEPGNLAIIRLVEKNDLSLVDALKERNLAWRVSNIFHLQKLLADYEPDLNLWQTLISGPTWSKILKILGWDPSEASCDECGAPSPRYFETRQQHFFCSRCYGFMKEKDTIITIE